MKKSKLTDIKPTKVLLYIVLAAFAVVQIYPLIFLVFFSLKDNNEIYSGNVMGIPDHFQWGNYENALFNANVGHYLLNSIFVTAVVIIVSDVLACMVSYAIARMRVKANRFVKLFFSIGLMIPIHAVLPNGRCRQRKVPYQASILMIVIPVCWLSPLMTYMKGTMSRNQASV